MIELIPCGTIVKTLCGNIEGMITAQSIRFDKVQYEITYFISGEEKVIWMHENQFETEVKKNKIGFK